VSGAVATGIALACIPLAAGAHSPRNGGSNLSSGLAAAKPVLTIGIKGSPSSSNPGLGGTVRGLPFGLTNEGPLSVSTPDGAYAPGLATSWGYVKQKPGSGLANKVFQFTLRHNARFSDGTPVTAQAVKTWFDYVDTHEAPFRFAMGVYGSTTTVGKWKVILHLKSPNGDVPNAISQNGNNWSTIASPRAVANPTLFEKGSYGAGPYTLDASLGGEWVAGDHYTLVPNPYYYDKSKIKFSKIIIRTITTPSSMLQAMRAGQLDVAFGDTSTVSAAEGAGLTVVSFPSTSYVINLGVDGKKVKALADVRVRQAMNYAVDRKAITTATAGKYGIPSSEIFSLDGTDPKYQNYYPYNPAKAKSMLAAAGYPNGFTIDPAVGCTCSGSQGVPMLQAVAKYLGDVGINVRVKSDDPQTFVDDTSTDPAPMSAQSAGIVPQTLLYSLIFDPRNPGTGIPDPEITKIWLRASRSSNPNPLWRQLTARVVKQAYFIPIYIGREPLYTRGKVTNIGFAKNTYNYRGWSPKP